MEKISTTGAGADIGWGGPSAASASSSERQPPAHLAETRHGERSWVWAWVLPMALLALPALPACHEESPNPSWPADGPGDPGDPSDEPDEGEGREWRSVLYPEDWSPDHTLDDGRFLHDFSYAGYRAGESRLPEELPAPLVSVIEFGADPTGGSDSTEAAQAALDSLENGGTVHLPAGDYRFDASLRVSVPGTVLAGDGPDKTRLLFTQDEGTTGGSGIWFRGSRPEPREWELAEDAEARAFSVKVVDADGLHPGDHVALGFVISDAFRSEHGMDEYWGFSAGEWRAFARRTVVAMDGDEVVLDVPVRYPARTRDHASLRTDDGYLTEVGIQDLAVSTAVSREAAMAANRHHAVTFDRVRDGWIRRIRSFAPVGAEAHLQSCGLLVAASRRVTVADVVLGPSQNRGGGGNGYLFEVGRSNEILIMDSVARGGRHNFIQNWDFGTSGCVFLRTTSLDGVKEDRFRGVGLSEYHHALAHANLVDDSVADDGWEAKNRHGYSSGAGHSATECVFWNVRGEGHLWSMQYGWGYVIGTAPELTVYTDVEMFDPMMGAVGTEPEDHVEGLGKAALLYPRSLYEDQLRRRLNAASTGG